LNTEGGNNESDIDDIEEEGNRNSQEVLEERVVIECNENPLSLQELKEALVKMKLGRSAGFDAVAPEMPKYMRPREEAMLLQVLELAWKQTSIPKDWEVAIIIPIFKNRGDNRDCKNHCGISLLCVAGKLYSRILEGRLRQQVENHLEEAQCGFRPSRGMQEAIFTIWQLAEKGIEYGKQMHLRFIDIEKAFNHVPQFIIWEVLKKKKNVPAAFMDRIRSLYTQRRNFVRTGNASSNYFLTNTGVLQGDILSELLFMLVMNEAHKECSNTKRYKVGNLRLRPVVINILAYADDLVLIADSAQKLQYNLNLLMSGLEKRKFKVSLPKTKTMIISTDERRYEIRVTGQVLEQVQEFKYLGTIISEDGKLKNEINSQIFAVGRMFHSIKNKFLRKQEVTEETKMVVYKTIYFPALTYGCESWALTTKFESRLQTNEMCYLRHVVRQT
jgi:hypothetical protein